MDKQDFISLCVASQAAVGDIDDYVERWHKGQAGKGMQLAEFLGMTAEEYAQWVLDPDQLPRIIHSRAVGNKAA